MTKLKEKRDEALVLLETTKEPEKFHDYISICQYLKLPNLPVNYFICLHNENPELAKVIVRFIWDELVEKKQWEICLAYMSNSMKKYEKMLSKFDQAMKVCNSDPSLGGKDFEKQIKGWYVRDISNILLVLKHNEMKNEFLSVRERVTSDLNIRKYPELEGAIYKKVILNDKDD